MLLSDFQALKKFHKIFFKIELNVGIAIVE